MKLLVLLPLLFCSCASARFYDRKTGKLIASFQGDMTDCDYADGRTHWKCAKVDHSTPTQAQGTAASKVISSSAAGVALIGLKAFIH
jgi:hypothetical protein